jgi:hypothetical protein
MSDFLHFVLDKAKENLVSHGYVTPVAFLMHDDEVINLEILTEESPDGNHVDFNVLCAGINAAYMMCNRVVMVWEAALKEYPKTVDLKNLDVTELPLTYPKSMRTECIIVVDVALPTGDDSFLLQTFKGGDGEPVEFLESLSTELIKVASRMPKVLRYGFEETVKSIKVS